MEAMPFASTGLEASDSDHVARYSHGPCNQFATFYLQIDHVLPEVGHDLFECAELDEIGELCDRPGAFMQPTILANVKPGNPAFRDGRSTRRH